VRVHGTTGEPPLERFQREVAALTSLPSARFVSSREEFRKVSWDGLVPFRGNKYGVPAAYSGKRVWVRTVRGHILQVHSQKGELVASHVLRAGKGAIVLLEGQYAGLRQPRTRPVLRQAFLERFPHHHLFLEKLQAQQKFNLGFHLRGILELAHLYPKEVLEEAFDLAERYNTFSNNFIQGLVERHAPREAPLPVTPLCLRPVPAVNVRGDLGVYQELLVATR
jgi:hypothetical protein